VDELPTESTALPYIVVVALALTLPVKVIPGLAKAVFAVPADFGVEQLESK
jgi:hypothetical protein